MDAADLESRIDARYRATGRRRPNLVWSKLEIGLGLLAMRVAFEFPIDEPRSLGASVVLFVLGGYLALAGHRSHLYDAMTKTAAIRVD